MSTVEHVRTDEDPPAAGGGPAPRSAHVPRALRGDARRRRGRSWSEESFICRRPFEGTWGPTTISSAMDCPLQAIHQGLAQRQELRRSCWIRRGETQPDGHLRIPAGAGRPDPHRDEATSSARPSWSSRSPARAAITTWRRRKPITSEAGVREYLVIELDPDRIHWFIRRGDHFEDLLPGPDGIYRSEVFPGLWLDAEAFFAEDLDRLVEVLEQGLATPEHAAFVARLAEPARERRPR